MKANPTAAGAVAGRGAAMVFGALLAACQAAPNANSCAYVEIEHLARPFDTPGLTRICNPKRVSPAYRDRYFPGYQWGDETW